MFKKSYVSKVRNSWTLNITLLSHSFLQSITTVFFIVGTNLQNMKVHSQLPIHTSILIKYMYLFWSDINIWRRSIPMKETFFKYRGRLWVDGKLNKSMSVVKRPYTCRQCGSSGACPSFSSSTEILTLSIRLDTIADLPREYVEWLNSVDIDRSGLIG